MKNIFEVIDENISDLGLRNNIKRAVAYWLDEKKLCRKISEDTGENVSIVFKSEKYIIVEMCDYKDMYESPDGVISKYKAVVLKDGKYIKTHALFDNVEEAILDTLAYLHEGINRRANIYAAQLLGLIK